MRPALVDVTGGAPELHPRIREVIVRLRSVAGTVQVRTNLSVLAEGACEDLPAFFAEHRVRLLASLPACDRTQYALQRDPGAFDAAIEALRRLNALGYGRNPELVLDLAVNPSDDQDGSSAEHLSAAMRSRLLDSFGIVFDHVVSIANMPLGRYADHLAENDRLQSRIDTLWRDFNPATLPRLACRRSVEVAWDGSLSDCDFNLSAGLGLGSPLSSRGPLPCHLTRTPCSVRCADRQHQLRYALPRLYGRLGVVLSGLLAVTRSGHATAPHRRSHTLSTAGSRQDSAHPGRSGPEGSAELHRTLAARCIRR